MEKKNNKKKMLSKLAPQQVIHVQTKYLMVDEDEYTTLKRENTEYKDQIYRLTQDADIFKQQIATDKETIAILRKENEELKTELSLLAPLQIKFVLWAIKLLLKKPWLKQVCLLYPAAVDYSKVYHMQKK